MARNAFGINVIALGLKFGFQLIYARALGVVGYGRFIYAINPRPQTGDKFQGFQFTVGNTY